MKNAIDAATIESLRSFAVCASVDPQLCAQSDREHFRSFADMCTAAVQGQVWAVERVTEVFRRIAEIDWSHRRDMTSPHSGIQDSEKLDVIRATGITRPDDDGCRCTIGQCEECLTW